MPLTSPKITIITVCYQSATTIIDTLTSISNQSYKNFEHLVIDGGSLDGTLELLRSWTGHPVRLISEQDEGIYDAMNKGLKLATGEIVGFLNADDFYSDASVLEQIARIFRDSLVEACYADLVYVNQDSLQVVRYWRSEPFRNGLFALGWCPAHPTFYVRRTIIEKFGNFDLSFKLAADAELMIRYLENHGVRTHYVPRVWVKMRLGGQTNQSWSNIVRQNKEIIRALKKNGIQASYIWFLAHKVLRRMGQYLMARIHKR